MLEILGIMISRQLKKYWRSKSRMIGSLAQPLIFLLAFGYGFGPVFSQAGQGNYVQFLAPGIMCMSVLFVAMFSGIDVIFDRQFGFLKETLVAPVSRFSIMLGKALGGAVVALLQGIIVFGITLIMGFQPHWPTVIIGFIFLALIGLFFTSLAMAIASRMTDLQGFPLIMNFLIMPTFFLSGALFPLEGLPMGLKILSDINPLSYGVDAVRASMMGTTAALGLDALILGGYCIIALAAGAWSFSKIEL